ncbi:MAG TPA: hypothetical protein VN436_02310 [Holophaga sp.]|nr:hypothetical protein [Holophaga sp.]
MIEIPGQEKLDAIKAQGYSGSILSKQVGPYRLSCVWRENSAMVETPSWYPESMILEGEWKKEGGKIVGWPRIRYQGEGWATFLHLANNLNTVAEVEAFLQAMEEEA